MRTNLPAVCELNAKTSCATAATMSAAPVQRIGVHHRGCLEVHLQHVGDLLRESRIGYDHRDLEVEAKGPVPPPSRTAEVMAEIPEYHILGPRQDGVGDGGSTHAHAGAGVHLIDGAGHWVQQEQADETEVGPVS
jgi:hypothetical protein